MMKAINQFRLHRIIIISLQMQQVTMDHNKLIKPITICCYICGRQFGSKSFSFHHKECILKFNNEQSSKPNRERVRFPESPSGLENILKGSYSEEELKKYNQVAKNTFKYKVLPSCKYCQRTFNAESLSVHMKGCSKKPLGPEEKQNQVQGAVKIPRALVGCVCGQRFGTASLRIHYPECVKKFNNQQFRKHRREEDRKKPPQFSVQDLSLLTKNDWKDEEIEGFNQRATENYRDKGMSECDNCGRKFFFEQMGKHRKNCELINGKISIGKKLSESAPLKVMAKPKTIICIICGRQYGTNSITIHSFQCEELFTKQQNLKPKQQRKLIPSLSNQEKLQFNLKEIDKWETNKIEKYNKIAFQIFNFKSLSKCYICMRTFFEESLTKHLKDCQLKLKDVKKLQKFKKEVKQKKDFFGDNFIQNVLQMNKDLSKSQSKDVRKPKMLICLLCGRQYGASSLKIHLPQCRGHNKQKKQKLQKVLEDIKGRFNINQAQKWSQEELEQYNKQVFQLYKKQSLHECKYCHRSFFQQSLSKHIKHCQRESKKKGKLRRCNTTLQTISQGQSKKEKNQEQSQQWKKEKDQDQKTINSNQQNQLNNQSNHLQAEDQESIQMTLQGQSDFEPSKNFIKCDLFTSIQFVIQEVQGEDSPSVIKKASKDQQKMLQIPTLQCIEIDDEF